MKIYLLCFTVGLMAATSSVHAATKCVKLVPTAKCSTATGESGQSNWGGHCYGITLSGIGLCGNQNGGVTGTTADVVQTSSDSTQNKYCWCKLISPAVSPWVFNDAVQAANCAHYCAQFCATYLNRYQEFRAALFSNLGD